MKKVKFLVLGLMTSLVIMAHAQSKNERSNDDRSRQSVPSKGNESRTINTETQPARTAKHVSREKVVYKREEPKAVAVRPSPQKPMKVVNHDNRDFYFDGGFYYKRYNNNYVRSAPPAGLRINILPAGYITVRINNANYFYFEGTYYLRTNNDYIVATPPVGAIVYALPVDYEKVDVDGVIYYEYNGVLYERIRYNNGRAYQVAGYID